MSQNQNQEKIDELDMVKFQLLISYLGMAKQKVSIVEERKSHCRAELELLDYKEREAKAEEERIDAELKKYHIELRTKYDINSEDGLNFATGEITRVVTNDVQNKIESKETKNQGK